MHLWGISPFFAKSADGSTPKFKKQNIDIDFEDGYWIDSFDVTKSGVPDIVAYGLNSGKLTWFENPNEPNRRRDKWISREIAVVDEPVGMCHAPIAGTDYKDIVISSQYGGTMDTIDTEGGKLHWYQNPLGKGGTVNDEWVKRYVGKAAGMHRVVAGYFTQTEHLELMGWPICGKPGNTHSVIEVKLWQQPEDIFNAPMWKETLINDTYFHVVHDVVMRKFRALEGDLRDSLIVASEEGLTWVYYDDGWNYKHIAGGVPSSSECGYWGCQNVDVGRIGEDPFAFIATSGPFHGNVAMVYMKERGALGSVDGAEWKEYTLDVYDNNGLPIRDGEGDIHHVVCADIDNDGEDEILFSLRDAGVMYFKIIDATCGKFQSWNTSEASAARSTVGDFSGDGRLGYATIGYGVEGYYESEDVELNVYYNDFVKHPNNIFDTIKLSCSKDSEVVVDIYPNGKPMYQYLITIYGFRHTIAYLPARCYLDMNLIGEGAMMKVISGHAQVKHQKNTAAEIIGNTCAPQGSLNLTILSDDGKVLATQETVLMIIQPNFNPATEDFPIIRDMKAANETIDYQSVSGLKGFSFEPYEGKTEDFCNMSGFTIQKKGFKLCHIQFWLAARNVNCGIHNHSEDDGKPFCEIHTCLINGTGNGGMYRSKKPYFVPPGLTSRSDMKKIVVPSGYEHGPMWNWDENGRPQRRSNGTVVYRSHAWIAGAGDPRTLTYAPSMDFWAAYELNPIIVDSNF